MTPDFIRKQFKKFSCMGLTKNQKPKTKNSLSIAHHTHTNEGGYSLIELLVSISVFVIIISVNSNIFISAIKGQEKAIATQNVSDSARYLMEVISKELRVARISSFVLVGADDLSFTSGAEHRLNKNIRFYLNAGSVMFDDDTTDANPAKPITSSKNVIVSSLVFTINNQLTQPKITAVIDVKSKGTSAKVSDSIILQTTISPRELNL
jgi:type II secretory pathway pseudopilin PulG